MRMVVQRVSKAEVVIDKQLYSSIGVGLCVFIGISGSDTFEDADWLCSKVCSLRVFSDSEAKMNHSVLDVNGDLLLISQFTLYASTKKGNRPSFIQAAKPEHAIPLYEYCIEKISEFLGKPVSTGRFGADMAVSLINDGPVTILIDSQNRE